MLQRIGTVKTDHIWKIHITKFYVSECSLLISKLSKQQENRKGSNLTVSDIAPWS